jgi:hypothetical protein
MRECQSDLKKRLHVPEPEPSVPHPQEPPPEPDEPAPEPQREPPEPYTPPIGDPSSQDERPTASSDLL